MVRRCFGREASDIERLAKAFASCERAGELAEHRSVQLGQAVALGTDPLAFESMEERAGVKLVRLLKLREQVRRVGV